MTKAYDEKLAAISSLRTSSDPQTAAPPLKKFLADKSNFVVSKAATAIGVLGLRDLIPDLLAAFERFLQNPAKSDPQCWAKNEIVKALKDLGHQDASVFLQGMAHVQMEPSYGGSVDSAGTLRGASALALVACSIPRHDVLTRLVDMLADPESRVRADVIVAIAQLPGQDVELLLRLKALNGDPEPAVIGQCFASFLDLTHDPGFVARFLDRRDDVAMEAIAALGACHEEDALKILKERFQQEALPQTRRAILLSLGSSRLESAIQFLREIAATMPNYAAAARDALKIRGVE